MFLSASPGVIKGSPDCLGLRGCRRWGPGTGCTFGGPIPYFLRGSLQGGPPDPVINGVKWDPYKWPEINRQLGEITLYL